MSAFRHIAVRWRRLAALSCALGCVVPALQAQGKHPPFRPIRYDEDYRYLADPAQRRDWVDTLKYVPLGDDVGDFASFGGELRTRYEYFREPTFGLRGADRDDFVLQRFLLHGDVHADLDGELRVRAFLQLLSGLVDGQELPKSAVQDNQFDVQQGFVELGYGPAALRLGRQELMLGSGRLVTTREPTNARLTFDTARLLYDAGATHFDLLLARPIEPETGVFDDEGDDEELLWGLYTTTPLAPERRLVLDLYYLGIERDAARFDRQVGREVRHSLGVRLAGRAAGFDHDTEAVWQFGDYAVAGRARQDVQAWTIASHTGYTFADVPLRPRVALKLNVASGDRDPNDGKLETFDPLYPRLNYFSDAALFVPFNFFDVHPSLQLALRDDLTLAVTSDLFFRQSRRDAVYGPRGPVVFGDQSRSRFIGSTTSVLLAWRATPRIECAVNYVRFNRGEVIEDAGGEAVDFVTAFVTMRF